MTTSRTSSGLSGEHLKEKKYFMLKNNMWKYVEKKKSILCCEWVKPGDINLLVLAYPKMKTFTKIKNLDCKDLSQHFKIWS
jgi:hypothetical protein